MAGGHPRLQQAFTLTEILVAVSVITAMAAVPAVSYGNHMKKVRDTKRKNDINQIVTALEQYKSQMGRYPKTEERDVLIQNGYLPEWPQDPREGQQSDPSTVFTYTYSADDKGQSYQLSARLEERSSSAVNIYNPDDPIAGDEVSYFIATPLGSAETLQKPGSGPPPTYTPRPTSTMIPTNTPRPSLTPSPARPLRYTPTTLPSPSVPRPSGEPGEGEPERSRPAVIAFSSTKDAGSSEIWTAPGTGSGPPQRLTTAGNLEYHCPGEISPDGTQIVYAQHKSGQNEQLFLISADGTQLRQLTPSNMRSIRPIWFPDGNAILFVGSSGDSFNLFRINTDGSNLQQLTSYGGSTYTDYAAKPGAINAASGKIAYHTNRDGDFEIYTMNLDGSGKTRITSQAGNDTAPVFSPDGAAIAFESNRDGAQEIYIMDADGGNARKLIAASSDLFMPQFSTNGATLYATDYAKIYYAAVPTRREGGELPPSRSFDGLDFFVRGGYMTFRQPAATGTAIQLLDLQSGVVTTIISGNGFHSKPSH